MAALPDSLATFSPSLAFLRLEESVIAERLSIPLDEVGEVTELHFGGARFRAKLETSPEGAEGSYTGHVSLEVIEGEVKAFAFELGFTDENWSRGHYLLMPAALYNGNRFRSLDQLRYAPLWPREESGSTHPPVTISDVPRLGKEGEPSSVEQLVGDLADPALGYFDARRGRAVWLTTGQQTAFGDNGFFLDENPEASVARFGLRAPGIRQRRIYKICDYSHPSPDRGVDLGKGDTVEQVFSLHTWKVSGLEAFYETYRRVRGEHVERDEPVCELPFSAAYRLIEEKYNRDNWREAHGLYSESPKLRHGNIWTPGWTGGFSALFALYQRGDAPTRERVLGALDKVMPDCVAESGLMWGRWDGERWCADWDNHPGEKFEDHRGWELIRRTGDGLFFACRFVETLSSDPAHKGLCEKLLGGIRRCADGLCRLWERDGQWGQFYEPASGHMHVGGSCSASLVPAALIQAAALLENDDYLAVAKEAGHHYYENFVRLGLTTGGPGDALQAPDSESASALLESFIFLHEATADASWLERARHLADQIATWVVPYDFKFPAGTTFEKLDIKSTGAIYANVQNKHGAPGICTLSGVGLLNLYRQSGETCYLDWITDIARCIPQTVSREDRPISEMPSGWISERVQLSDWNEPVGEVLKGSCWCEIAMMLSYVELPGIYVAADRETIAVFDNLKAAWHEANPCSGKLRVENPTAFPAHVRVLLESEATRDYRIEAIPAEHWREIDIPAGGETLVALD